MMNEYRRTVRIETCDGPERRIRFKPTGRRGADWTVIIERWNGCRWVADDPIPAKEITVDGVPLTTPTR